MEWLSKRICSVLIKQSAKEHEKELYEYAILLVLNFLLNFSITLILACIFNKILECVLMVSAFLILRKFTGGLHLKRKLTCHIASILLVFAFLVYMTYSSFSVSQSIINVTSLVSCIVVAILSPLENNNRPLSDKEKKVYKIVAVIISALIGFAIIKLYGHRIMIAKSLLISLVLDLILLVLGTIVSKRSADNHYSV